MSALRQFKCWKQRRVFFAEFLITLNNKDYFEYLDNIDEVCRTTRKDW